MLLRPCYIRFPLPLRPLYVESQKNSRVITSSQTCREDLLFPDGLLRIGKSCQHAAAVTSFSSRITQTTLETSLQDVEQS
jgi:hypothetical protein